MLRSNSKRFQLAAMVLVGLLLGLNSTSAQTLSGGSQSAVPVGTASGDLGGSYPGPTVVHGNHITDSSITNSGLANPSATVNSQSCVLGASCTVTVPVASGLTGLGTGVATALGNNTNATGGVITPVTGTWTPVLNFSIGTAGLSASCVGSYTQYGAAAGDYVFASFNCTVTAIGTASGNASITGLPLTSNANNFFSAGMVWQYAGMLTMSGGLYFQVARNGTVISLLTDGATGQAAVTSTNFANGSSFQGTVVYAQ